MKVIIIMNFYGFCIKTIIEQKEYNNARFELVK